MAKVVFVHGVGKQYLSEDSLARDVIPELRGGARLAGGPVPDAGDVGIAFYGDLFRPRGTRAGYVPDYDVTDIQSDDEVRLLMEWWMEAARTDPNVPAPDESGTRGPAGWALSQTLRLKRVRAALDALTGARFFGGVLDKALIGDLKQLTGYFNDEAIRAEARGRLVARITSETRVVVAHSLGSVIAYETLCEEAHSDWNVQMLVTLGSPLGMGTPVLDRLRPAAANRRGVWPTAAQRWTNIADATDVVAVVRELSPIFGSGLTDVAVHNGAHMHDATRYLTAVETGRALVAGLRQGDEAVCDM
ncbi:antibiotic ABC transporter ATP-binding protein [Streptomyces sp. NBC_01242]|uniref:antibiotic ABC transporter ATP-binding protein n=1 Tax=Streptomyces sp. NBC_01242 TaxID=2903795 RepID=UPI0022559D0E|nr:antibiotic ABC transporter ATP-binding protein [Streptomyces sp. NBC_01242]MCX4797643.1 antibiotic ABC transporter ATP-binding protein [Streptomyces sp. NBC_01242]